MLENFKELLKIPLESCLINFSLRMLLDTNKYILFSGGFGGFSLKL